MTDQESEDRCGPVEITVALPARLVELVDGRVKHGVYASTDDFIAEAVRERLRTINGAYVTLSVDMLSKPGAEADEADQESGADATE